MERTSLTVYKDAIACDVQGMGADKNAHAGEAASLDDSISLL